MMSEAAVRTRRFTRLEYDRLVEQGFFRPDDRIELLAGRLVVKEPQDSAHATAVLLVLDALRGAVGTDVHVRPGTPVAMGRWSEPEPDVSVVPGAPRHYRSTHPAHPVLVVEVASSRLRFDRTRKAAVYARAGVPEYWIVDVVGRALEVRREPERVAGRRPRWGYRSVERLGPDDTVTPLAAPGARIGVGELLP